jgi:mono/diheme cytochrome c family protein
MRWLALVVVLVGCAADQVPTGEEIYRARVEDGNTFTCATCHAVREPADDGLRRPGHPLADAARRTSYKNGHVESLHGAVNTCLTEWMGAPPWAEDDARWISLRDWLESIAPPGKTAPITSEIVEPPTAVDGGDPDTGRALFDQTCAVCHGAGGVGTERGPRVIGFDHDPAFVARRIRTSGSETSAAYPGLTGGRMPFWAADRLSDREVLDLAAFVSTSDDTEGGGGGGDTGGAKRVCGSSHAKVGRTTTLSQRAHGVSGTARIVDDCTIRFESFSYDGGGIDVRVYAGLGGNYRDGFAISPNILGQPYTNGTLDVQLPIGKTLDDLDGVSIWCVAVSFSFGDGSF